MTQTERLLAWLRANPGSSGLEIVHALSIPKYTSRISDLREQGFVILPVRRPDGRTGYIVEEQQVQVERGEQTVMAL